MVRLVRCTPAILCVPSLLYTPILCGVAIAGLSSAAWGQAESKPAVPAQAEPASQAGQAPPAGAPEAPQATPSAPATNGKSKLPPPRIYPEPTEAERRIAAALERPADVNYLDAQLGDVINDLSQKFDLSIELDVVALTADGKGSETLVNKTLRSVRLKSILYSILDEQNLTFVVHNDVLLITSKSAAELYTRARTYQVHDLVVQANDPTAGRPDFKSLIELIFSTIAPETWREAGGTQGEVKEFYGPGVIALVITQTDEVHGKIQELLASMRAAQIDSLRDVQSRMPQGAGPPSSASPYLNGSVAIGNTPATEPTAKPPRQIDDKKPAVAVNILSRFPPPRVFPEPTEAERRILAALDRPAEVNWLDTQLADAARELELKFGVPFQLDTEALVADGKSGETLINKQLKGISLRNLLKLMLEEQELTFTVRDGAILITTRSKNDEYVAVRTYQVYDLVVMANDPTAAQPDFQSLIELITSTIRPETWREAGGISGETKEYVGAGVLGLVVTQTFEAHEEVAELLAALRAARLAELAGLQVNNPLPAPQGGGYAGTVAAPAPQAHLDVAPPPEMSSLYRQLVAGETDFACNLYRQLDNKPTENIVFSPHGATTSLETLLVGARRKTAAEFRTVLNLPDDESVFDRIGKLHAWIDGNKAVRGYQLTSRTRLLVAHDEPLLASFVGRTLSTFDARIEPLDFSRGRTEALIPVLNAAHDDSGGFLSGKGLTDDVDENTRLYVLNTTGFRGRWALPFPSDQTLRESFYSPNGKLNVEMMHLVGPAGYREVDGLQIVGKEYAGLPGVARAMFYILLPSNKTGALAECERTLSQPKLARWLDEIEEQSVELHLPKFTFENQHDFRTPLIVLGLRQAFSDDPAAGADFSGINGSQALYLQGVRQRAKIEVNEEVTHAVAHTAAPVGTFGGPAEPKLPKRVRCDRPFLFLIRDEVTGTILFMGRVAAPDHDPKAPVAETPPSN